MMTPTPAPSIRSSWITAGILLLTVTAYAHAQSFWTTASNLNVPRSQTDGATIGSKFYVAGDASNTGSGHTFEIFDSTTGTWSFGPAMPGPRSNTVTLALDGRVYVGYGSGAANGDCGNAATSLYVFDTATNLWSVGSAVPLPRCNAAGAALGDKLYFVGGGYPGVGTPNQVRLDAYHPASNTWTSLAPMPEARLASAVAAHDGKLYVFGGVNAADTQTATTFIYDPLTNAWTIGSPVPAPSLPSYGSAVSFGGRVHVLGGLENSGAGVVVSARHWAYTPATDSWVAEESLPAARMSMAAGVLGGSIIAAGGHSLTTTYLFTPPEPLSVNAGGDQLLTSDVFGAGTAELSATVTGGAGGATVTWSGPAGFTASGASISVMLGLGVHTFTATATEAGEPAVQDTVVISVQIPVVPGEQGIQGPKGDKGDKGDQGIQGPQGLKGDQGLQGAQGPKGDSGANGTNGADGAKGDKGDQGIQGLQGPAGPAGEGLISGALMFLQAGTTPPAGWTLIGTFNQSLSSSPSGRGGGAPQTMTVNVYRKN